MSQQVENRRPVVMNLSTLVESQDRNKEETEVFQCFYPDDATNEYSGGFDEPGAFRNYVESMQSKGYSVEFRVNLKREFVNNDNHEQLVCGNLLQFPYGRGGPSENREVVDKSIKRVYLEKYIKHLSQKSDVVFQSPMIQLLMYSQISKVRLLEYSRLQVRGTVDASRIAESFSPGELDRTIESRRNGSNHAGDYVSNRILDSVDAISRSLPHTNEASRKARNKGEAMQHHFGQASVFLTVSFDDDNSFLIQVMSGYTIDDTGDLNGVTDEEIHERSVQRRSLRLN
jgi:hypothetical protein